MNTLEIQNLSKIYAGGIRALDGVTLTIGNGMFGLLGPNGAGKSTLMRTIATLQAPDAGSIHFNGQDVQRDPRALRAQLGYLPQEFGVYPRLSAWRLLDHLAVLKGVLDKDARREQVGRLLHLTNLHQDSHRPVSTFSGGMRRRFGVAQALLGNPRLVIVDEPTAGLDPEERRRFHDLLSEIGEQVIVLLSTHIVEDVRDLCRRMAILAGGRIVLSGEPAQLTARLNGRIWRKVIAGDRLTEFRQAFTVISTRLLAGERWIHVRADSRPGPDFDPVTPSLEDVYFSVLFDHPSA